MPGQSKTNPPGHGAAERVQGGWSKHPHGHHMAVPAVAVELRGGRPADRAACAAMSELSAAADGLGWVLALAAGAPGTGAAGLDSARAVSSVSAKPCALTRSGARPAAGRRGGDRPRAGA